MLNVSKFKERVKLLCKKTGISQKHLTDMIGRKNTYLNDVWNGKCTLKNEDLTEFAKILGTSCEYLSGETDNQKRQDSENEASAEDEELLALFKKLTSDKKETLKKLIEQMSEKSEQ